MTLTNQDYYLPVAAHRIHPERLLLLDEHERWFIWSGGPGDEPLAIEPALGHWMAHRPELFPLPEPLMWIAGTDLPVLSGQRSAIRD